EPPVATVVGSSNYGGRSAYKDLESQLVLVTDDAALRGRLDEEAKSMTKYCRQVDEAALSAPDRQAPLFVRFLARLLEDLF
ncbi:CDP-diacylglycerol--glycerol-3-phosphate 3-phosphatidyltransferase, partial [Cladochytrium tenue]